MIILDCLRAATALVAFSTGALADQLIAGGAKTGVITVSTAQSPFVYTPSPGTVTVDVYVYAGGGGGGGGSPPGVRGRVLRRRRRRRRRRFLRDVFRVSHRFVADRHCWRRRSGRPRGYDFEHGGRRGRSRRLHQFWLAAQSLRRRRRRWRPTRGRLRRRRRRRLGLRALQRLWRDWRRRLVQWGRRRQRRLGGMAV